MEERSDDATEGDHIKVKPVERYILSSPTYRRREIVEYVHIEGDPDEMVTHCERIDMPIVGTARYEIWDVHTSKQRYWVITNLTNLYEQAVFPSMDMCLTFHIGFMARMKRFEDLSPETLDLFIPATTKRLERARRALDAAQEAEEFQAVGLRCREALLAMVRELCTVEMVPPGVTRPKRADFLGWTSILADWLTPNERDQELRSTMKSSAKHAWRLANSITHSTSSYMHTALQTFNQCEYAIYQLNWARIYRDDALPPKCPRCDSYRVTIDLERTDDGYRRSLLCESCGWTKDDPRDSS